jgi:hypothetical protein
MQGHYSATQLKGILENYIETIMQHDHNKYPGVVNRWTIVSEATHLCGVFCQGLGKDELKYWNPQTKQWIVEPSDFDVWAGDDSTASLHTDLIITQ